MKLRFLFSQCFNQKIFQLLTLFLLACCLVSCSSERYRKETTQTALHGEKRFVPDQQSSKNIVPVFYGTDRKGTGPEANRKYATTRGDLEYGLAYVSIPENHDPGHLERPYRLLSVTFNENKDDHVVIIKPPQQLAKVTFFKELQQAGMKDAEDGVFVFIHGYNVSFEDALLRTGQLAFDLSFDGPTIAYSWPSKNRIMDYLTDGVEIELTKPHLKQFFSDLKQNLGKKRICVLAHSMGNRAFTQVLAELAKENQSGNTIFDQIVLAAPDIDAEIFEKAIAPAINGTARQISLYTSENDNVLEFSSSLRDSRPRAGEAGNHIVVVDGINTIDASKTNDGFSRFFNLGHSYYGEQLIVDLHSVFKNGLTPDQRFLRKTTNLKGDYWELLQ